MDDDETWGIEDEPGGTGLLLAVPCEPDDDLELRLGADKGSLSCQLGGSCLGFLVA